MPLVTEEQKEKQESTFLKYEADNVLEILSNLYKIDAHYIKSSNKFVACLGKECGFCKAGNPKHLEFNYWVKLNGTEGIMNIKPSVFYSINEIERASKKDKRSISWLVLKSGSGLNTEYTVSKNENLDKTLSEEQLEVNNKKLSKVMLQKEDQLNKSYREMVIQIDPNDIPDPEEENA